MTEGAANSSPNSGGSVTTPQEVPPATTPEAPETARAAEPKDAPELKYSDRDLDKYKGSARKEGRQAAINELLGRVEGAGSVDELVTAWQEKRELEAAAQTEAERLQSERDALKSERDAANKALAAERISFRLEAALRDAGVPSERIGDALTLADRSGLEVGKDGSVSGLEDAVSATVGPRPWLVGSPASEVVPTTETTEQQSTDSAVRSSAPDATPRPAPRFDPASMTDEEINKLAEQVTRGSAVPILSQA